MTGESPRAPFPQWCELRDYKNSATAIWSGAVVARLPEQS